MLNAFPLYPKISYKINSLDVLACQNLAKIERKEISRKLCFEYQLKAIG